MTTSARAKLGAIEALGARDVVFSVAGQIEAQAASRSRPAKPTPPV
jgi:hypothetical protein